MAKVRGTSPTQLKSIDLTFSPFHKLWVNRKLELFHFNPEKGRSHFYSVTSA